MPDDKHTRPDEGDFALEEILEEVSSWLEEEALSEPPLPEVLLDLMPPALTREEAEPGEKPPGSEEVQQAAPPQPQREQPSPPPAVPPAQAPQQEEAPPAAAPPQEDWSGRPDAAAFGEPLVPSQVVRLPTPKELQTPEGAPSGEEAPAPPESEAAPAEQTEAETLPVQTAPGEASPTQDATAPESGPPDNIITLHPKKEPETIREAVTQAARQARSWARESREQRIPSPKPRLKRPRLPRLPGPPTPPDTDPRTLAKAYGEGLSRLRLLGVGAFFCLLALLSLTLFREVEALPFPQALAQGEIMGWVDFGLFALTALLCAPILKQGLKSLLSGRPGMETLALLATLLVAADALTLLLLELRPHSQPHYLPVMAVLAFQLLGGRLKRRQQRVACRTAAQTARPDRLLAEPNPMGGGVLYRCRPGAGAGFGSQIQQEDGAERVFRLYAPVALLLTLGLSLLATVAKGRPELLCWALSGGLIAAATLGGALCFSLPNRSLSPRLARDGVALAGWTGIRGTKSGAKLLVGETDLFPPGSVRITSARSFGSFSQEKVFSVAASVIRATGSGLGEVFDTLMRMEGGAYVTVSDLEQQKDGISARALGEEVLVGTGPFLERHGVELPQGVRVKTGAFAAIGGQFAGQFVLSYTLHKRAGPAMARLLSNGITPIWGALDFNLSPTLLRKLFRFPWDRMAHPGLAERQTLLEAPPHGEGVLLAMLGVEGLYPLSIAAVGAQRLRKALRLCLAFTLLGGFVGIFLAFYLAQAAALTALSALNLTAFLFLWALPLFLISGWVNQF